VKYDDASWHHGGDFPANLPPEAAATHTGMFVAWAFLSGLAGEIHIHDFPDDVPSLESRTITPGKFFLSSCDGKFTDEDLNDQGNAFAAAYFNFDNGRYLGDYESTLGQESPSLYHIEDSWENFDRLRPVLDQRFSEWKRNT